MRKNGLEKIAVAEVEVPVVGPSDGNGRLHLRSGCTSCPDSEACPAGQRDGGGFLMERELNGS